MIHKEDTGDVRSGQDRHLGIDALIRHHLASLARRRRNRSLGWPRDWRPGQVRNPNAVLDDFNCFTLDSAWEFIASRLEDGEDVEVIDMKEPRGAGKGYVMKIDVESDDGRRLYVKVQLGQGKIVGRSSHYDKPR